LNHLDIVHYYHLGNPIQKSLIFPDGMLITGQRRITGECFQLHVPSGVGKLPEQLMTGLAEYGLISEAVSRGLIFR
jgi:predicted cupin superfamily sugar epimerase